MNPDEELVRLCAAGDPAAWRRFVDLYAGWVLRVARSSLKRFTGSVHEPDAEDAAADVFRQLVERDRAMLRSLRPPYNLRAWLAIVTRRACARQMRRKPPPLKEPAVLAPASGLNEILERLPPADRLLLELFFVHDCSYEEIGAILGISAESVGKQKFRVLEKLRQLTGEP